MAAAGGAPKGAQRKKRVQGPWMDSVEQLALLRTGIAVSISSMETTAEMLEKNMGEQWPEQLERAAKEHGWSEKNLKKRCGTQPWTLELAKTARVELKRLWSQYLVLKRWCINVANPQYVKFLNADLSVPSGTNKEDVMAFMRGIFWLLEEHKKAASAKRKATKAATKAQQEPATARATAAPKQKRATAPPPVVANPNPDRPNGKRTKQVDYSGMEAQDGAVPYAAHEALYQAPPKENVNQQQAPPLAEAGGEIPEGVGPIPEEEVQISLVKAEGKDGDDADEVEVTNDDKDVSEMLGNLGIKDRHEVAEKCHDMPDSFEGPTQLLAWSVCGPIGDNENHIGLSASDNAIPSRKDLREDMRDHKKRAGPSSASSSSTSTPKAGASTPIPPTAANGDPPAAAAAAAAASVSEQRERFLRNQTIRNQTSETIAQQMQRMQRMSELNMLLQIGDDDAKAKAREEMIALINAPAAAAAPPTNAPPPQATTPL